MFTVLICDKRVQDACYQQYQIYLKPFLDTKEFEFCTWNSAATTFAEALPSLKDLVRGKKEWRAVVVNDSDTWSHEQIDRRNPFDVTGGEIPLPNFDGFHEVLAYRKEQEECLEKALSNPLARLAIWLCGAPIQERPEVCYAAEAEAFEAASDTETYRAVLKRLGISAADAERDRVLLRRFEALRENFEPGGEFFYPPAGLLAVSERSKDIERELARAAWSEHTEFDYSQFYLSNLYPQKLRYLICDVPYIRLQRHDNSYFNFLTLVMILAQNEVPSGVMRADRVYSAKVEVDSAQIRHLCRRYTAKLKATQRAIDRLSYRISEEEREPVDRDTAELCFERDVVVPVKVDSTIDKDDLFAEYRSIGLSKDCPEDELGFWNRQYHNISKLFIRYLREPRRAVKTATKESFRRQSRNTDERALRLNEYQKEDVLIHLQNEETEMVRTVTTGLFDTASYKSRMEQADRELRRGISQRMTKKKTWCVGLIAALAFLIGFLPLLWSNLNVVGTWAASFGMIGMALGTFLLSGLIYLFVLRRRLVNRFKHFNYEMSGITGEIEASMEQFSTYLSHACNVMRGFSVLERSENSYRTRKGILEVHRRAIDEKLKEVHELFSIYLTEEEEAASASETPYEFDFARLAAYQYEMPYEDCEHEILYLQEGNTAIVPVDYLSAVNLTREELYD